MSKFKFILICFAAACAAATGANSPTENDIYGTVTNREGNPVFKAAVELMGTDYNVLASVKTDKGVFLFSDVQPGEYRLAITAEGYKGHVFSVNKQKGKALDASTVLSLVSFKEKMTVLGTRAEMEVADYPGSVDTLKGDEMIGTFGAIEGLSEIPGFETGGGHARNIGQQFTIRGFGYQSEERVIIKQDGVRRSANLFSNHISSFRTEPEILKQVEVVKGASSVSHGGGAIGGIVGMTTKDASDYVKGDDTFAFNVTARAEDNNHQSLSLTAAGKNADRRFSYMVFGKFSKTGDLEPADDEADPVENDEDITTLFAKIGFQIDEYQNLVFSYFDMKEEIETVWQTVYHGQYPEDGPVIGELRQKDTVLTYTYQPDSDWIDFSAKLSASEGYYDRTADFASYNILVDYKNEDKTQGLSLKNVSQYVGNSVTHRIIVGLDYDKRQEDAIYRRNGELSDFGSMPNDYKDLGLYFQDDIFLFQERLMLLLGGRYDSFDRSVDHQEGSYEESRFSPRVGLSFEAVEGLRLLANYSEAFRAPTPHETSSNGPLNPHYWYLPNPDLKPETAGEMEVGFAYTNNKLRGGTSGIMLKGMYFDGEIDKMIAFRTLPDLGESPQGSPYGTFQNVNKAERDGYEFSVNYYVNNWTANGSFEHLDMVDSETKEKVPSAFADKARLSLSYKIPQIDLLVGGNFSHWFKPDQNPESFWFRGTEYFYVKDEFSISNLWIRWKPERVFSSFFDQSFELHFGVKNLLNDTYINARNVETTSRSGKGRNVWMAIKKTF